MDVSITSEIRTWMPTGSVVMGRKHVTICPTTESRWLSLITSGLVRHSICHHLSAWRSVVASNEMASKHLVFGSHEKSCESVLWVFIRLSGRPAAAKQKKKKKKKKKGVCVWGGGGGGGGDGFVLETA